MRVDHRKKIKSTWLLKYTALVLASLAVFVICLPLLKRNVAAVATLRSVITNQPWSQTAGLFASFQNSSDCRIQWMRGRVAYRAGESAERDQAWTMAFRCLPELIGFAEGIAPHDQTLARFANTLQPENAETWFWLARTAGAQDPSMAIPFYQQGLALNPRDGIRWRELGDLLNGLRPQEAIQAYLQSCFNGDPGSNGCWGAGNTAYRLGDLNAAICYWRLSHWIGARNRANEIEAQLKSEGKLWRASDCPPLNR